MRKILEKHIKVNIPYYSVNGSSLLSKTTNMNEIQSRIILMIVSHKELGVSGLTLGGAIEKVYGLIPNNLPIIKKDIIELVKSKTIKIDLKDKDIFEQKVMILDLRLNKGVKSNVLSKEKYSLITSNSRRVNVKLAVPLFDNFKTIENPIFSNQEELKINNSNIYSESQFEDLIEQHITVDGNETLEEIELSSKEPTVGWVQKELNIKIEDRIMPMDDNSEIILDLISSGNIEVDPSYLLNSKINRLKLMPRNDESLKVETGVDARELNDSNQAIETRFKMNQYSITKYYVSSFKSFFNNKETEIKEIISEDVKYFDLFKGDSKNFDPTIIEQFDNVAKIEFILAICEGAKTPESNKRLLLEYMTIKLLKEMDSDSIKNLISSRELFNYFFERNLNKIKADKSLISKLFELGYYPEEWFLKNTLFQYKQERLFHNWKLEKEFFKSISKLQNIDLSSRTKGELSKLKIYFDHEISDLFKEQKIYKSIIDKLNSTMNLASNWSEDKIISEGMKLRDKLESFAKKNSNLNPRNHTLKEMLNSAFKKDIVSELHKSYKELSNTTGHNISKTSNLEKEKIVKSNLTSLGNIFNKPIKELKLEIEKDEVSNVA